MHSPKCNTNYLVRVLSTIILIIDRTHKTFPKKKKNNTDNVTVFTKRLWIFNFDDSLSHESIKDTNPFAEVRKKELYIYRRYRKKAVKKIQEFA